MGKIKYFKVAHIWHEGNKGMNLFPTPTLFYDNQFSMIFHKIECMLELLMEKGYTIQSGASSIILAS